MHGSHMGAGGLDITAQSSLAQELHGRVIKRPDLCSVWAYNKRNDAA
jgi:hypothetical protein